MQTGLEVTLPISRGGGGMSREELELARVLLGRDRLIVAADLAQVGSLKVQSELHQDVGNAGGGLVGKREVLPSRVRHHGKRLPRLDIHFCQVLATFVAYQLSRRELPVMP